MAPPSAMSQEAPRCVGVLAVAGGVVWGADLLAIAVVLEEAARGRTASWRGCSRGCCGLGHRGALLMTILTRTSCQSSSMAEVHSAISSSVMRPSTSRPSW